MSLYENLTRREARLLLVLRSICEIKKGSITEVCDNSDLTREFCGVSLRVLHADGLVDKGGEAGSARIIYRINKKGIKLVKLTHADKLTIDDISSCKLSSGEESPADDLREAGRQRVKEMARFCKILTGNLTAGKERKPYLL